MSADQIAERKFPWRLSDIAVKLGSLYRESFFPATCQQLKLHCCLEGQTIGRGSQAEVRLGVYQGAVVAFKVPLEATKSEMLDNLATEVGPSV